MDPYHELVHVIGYILNEPPALIDEGTAVYLSQLYGDKAFSKMIGYPTKSINEILLLHNKKEGLITISTLLSYDEIGNSNKFVLEYCTSASFVDFLIKEFGKQKFLELYKSLSNTNRARNEIIFEKIYRVEFSQIEYEWTKYKSIDKIEIHLKANKCKLFYNGVPPSFGMFKNHRKFSVELQTYSIYFQNWSKMYFTTVLNLLFNETRQALICFMKLTKRTSIK
ncbi:MAG: hypothetical protein IPF54_06910 [Draconibacterium sp.]|nr:hypothetical protein [Draconibacterium sp.]